MRVNQISNIGGTGSERPTNKEQKSFDNTVAMDQKYNESTRFGRESGFSPEDAEKQRELRRKLGRQTFQTILDGEIKKYKK